MTDSCVEQSDFLYFECSECGFDSVQKRTFNGDDTCPVCDGDNNRYVPMRVRVCRSTDKPEGRDARLETNS